MTDYVDAIRESRGGFDFENCARNKVLCEKLDAKMRAKKTGTTICGVVCGNHGVVLAADTRATAGAIVADKDADKLHPIAPNIQCAGAGTSADLTATTENMERQMEMHRLNTGTQTRVCTVVQRLKSMLFQYQGHIGCALVLGGVDVKGPHLYQIYPHGSTDKLPFTTMGSGSLAAMAVLEAGYKDNLTIEEGKELVAAAIRAGVDNDLGSGGNIDVCAITRDKNADGSLKKEAEAVTKVHTRKYQVPYKRENQAQYPKFQTGTTKVIETNFRKHVQVIEGAGDGDVDMGM